MSKKKPKYVLFYENGYVYYSNNTRIKKPRGQSKAYFISIVNNCPLKKIGKEGNMSIINRYVIRVGLNFLEAAI